MRITSGRYKPLYKNTMNNIKADTTELDVLAEQWVEIILAHIEAKKLKVNEEKGEKNE